jgi:DmsE family decaheme c-type cytochrome
VAVALKNRTRHPLALLIVAIAVLLCPLVTESARAAQQKQAAKPVAAPTVAVPSKPSDFVGEETCALCHADQASKFSSNPHSKLALLHGGKGVTCESCHGAGKAHVDGGGDITKIFRFSTASPKQIDATCLGCHAAAHPDFERSPHAKGNVSCTSCHSVHASAPDTNLLKVAEPTLCFACHTDIKPAFSQPFHHKVNEGLLKCSDCHDTHGTFGAKQLRSTADQNLVCTKCHTETMGPFAYEHPPVKVEGCLSCHTPHGSQNARLLNVPNVNALCIGCHSEISGNAIRGTTPVDSGHNQNGPTVACTNCHSQIHGSNVSQYFLQ